jgi:hypothetical protein
MCDQWLSDMDKGKINGVVSLDIRKAFDSINHKILLRKLKNQFGIHDIELKWKGIGKRGSGPGGAGDALSTIYDVVTGYHIIPK